MAWQFAALAAAQVGSSILGGMAAEEAAKEAAEDAVKLNRTKRLEERRQMRRAAGQQLGTARAAIGASNIQFGGSSKRYLEALNYENMREIAYHRQLEKQEAEAIMAGAQGAGTPFFAQAAGDAIGYAARAFAMRPQAAATGSWGTTPGTVSDPFLNSGEAYGAFDGSF
jgi:hypothetical protein